ncbi:MAG: hypothetical protein VXZ78_01855 [Pseudomonadota bacterium]|nr:hypothetical protein [Pseudomonadota bacterium]
MPLGAGQLSGISTQQVFQLRGVERIFGRNMNMLKNITRIDRFGLELMKVFRGTRLCCVLRRCQQQACKIVNACSVHNGGIRQRCNQPVRCRTLIPRHVGFAEQNKVGLGQLSRHKLANKFVMAFLRQGGAVGYHKNPREEEPLNTGTGQRKPRRFAGAAGLDQNGFGRMAISHKHHQLAGQVFLHLAARATIGQRERGAVMVGNKSGVNIHLAEVIDQHGYACPVRFTQ